LAPPGGAPLALLCADFNGTSISSGSLYMISFSKLGNYGRLGNQLFQYAFLRSSAKRLNTKFYCPKWDGDEIFELRDDLERATSASGIINYYDPGKQAGFAYKAMQITDNTEIQGFFQSEKYYSDKQLVRKWYTFNPAIVEHVGKHYSTEYLQDVVSLSLRIDTDYANTREYFPQPSISYFETALRFVNMKSPLLVFSDRPDLAVDFFKPLGNRDIRFVSNLDAARQLYLMTQCKSNIIINSTFAWWGAWLNSRPGRTIITPKEWCRPGVPNGIDDIICNDWLQIRSTIPIWDNFQLWRLRHPISTFERMRARKGRTKAV
jgi:hypothetical protein